MGHHHRPARLHRPWGDSPGGAGVILLLRCLNRYAGNAADIMVGPVIIPQRAGEIIASYRVGGGNGVRKGCRPSPRQDESDLSGGVVVDIFLVQVVAGYGYVGEPGGQHLRDSPEPPVVVGGDGHHHRPARLHRPWGDSPGGAGVILLLRCLNRYAGNAADIMVGPCHHPSACRRNHSLLPCRRR